MVGVAAVVIAAAASVAGAQQAAAPRKGSGARTGSGGRYATVNGLRMYFEVHGPERDAGTPLVLLHGALSTIETDFGKVLPTLAKTRRVIAVEQQAHGHTADADRPLSYAQMADDTAELLRQLGIENADFLGYSMGGGVALQVASRHPALVRKLVFAGGTSYNPDGLYPELLEGMKRMKPEDLAGSPWQRAYARVAPQPERWGTLVGKIKELDLSFAGWPPEVLQAITAPTLLMIGDADIVRPEHTVRMFRLLGGGVPGDLVGLPRSRLAVLPGTTHVTLVDRTDWLLSMVSDFLDAPMPKAR
ncbi:MAG: alpha/beta fold hydrolase [Gemmatimonadaceae bacterium]